MAGIQLSTAGVKVFYTTEGVAATKQPTEIKLSELTQIPEIKSIPELNPEPDNLETTTLEETEWRTYIPGLKDPGGALPFTANLTNDLMDKWQTLLQTYDTAAEANNVIWFVVVIPGLKQSLFFTGKPSPLGMPGMEVSSVLETTLYITATNSPSWNAQPTDDP